MMRQSRARAQARHAMKKAGLGKGWSFGWHSSGTRGGQTRWSTGGNRITLSRQLTRELTPQQVDQIIAHEVAHARTGRADHGKGMPKRKIIFRKGS